MSIIVGKVVGKEIYTVTIDGHSETLDDDGMEALLNAVANAMGIILNENNDDDPAPTLQ